jgi:hypothetical protein
LVYRPYLEGRISGGVEEEIIYKSVLNPNLSSHGAVYFPVEDKRDFFTVQLKEVFVDKFRNPDAAFKFVSKQDPTEAILTVINSDKTKLDQAYQSVELLATFVLSINTELIRQGIVESNDSIKTSAMSGQKSSLAIALYFEMASKVYKALDGVFNQFAPAYVVFESKYQIRDIINSIKGSVVKNNNN